MRILRRAPRPSATWRHVPDGVRFRADLSRYSTNGFGSNQRTPWARVPVGGGRYRLCRTQWPHEAGLAIQAQSSRSGTGLLATVWCWREPADYCAPLRVTCAPSALLLRRRSPSSPRVLHHRVDQPSDSASPTMVRLADPAGVAVPADSGHPRRVRYRGHPVDHRQIVVGLAETIRTTDHRWRCPAARTCLDSGAGRLDPVRTRPPACSTSPSGTSSDSFFTTTHYAVAYLALGAVLVHLAVKLPVIRQGWADRSTTRPPKAQSVRTGVPFCVAPGWQSESPRWQRSDRRCRCCAAYRCSPLDPAKGRRVFRSTAVRVAAGVLRPSPTRLTIGSQWSMDNHRAALSQWLN